MKAHSCDVCAAQTEEISKRDYPLIKKSACERQPLNLFFEQTVSKTPWEQLQGELGTLGNFEKNPLAVRYRFFNIIFVSFFSTCQLFTESAAARSRLSWAAVAHGKWVVTQKKNGYVR